MDYECFVDIGYVSQDIGVTKKEAANIIKHLNKCIESEGGLAISREKVSRKYYEDAKKKGFKVRPVTLKDKIPRHERDLWSMEEFAIIAGEKGIVDARRFAKKYGLEAREPGNRRVYVFREKWEKLSNDWMMDGLPDKPEKE